MNLMNLKIVIKKWFQNINKKVELSLNNLNFLYYVNVLFFIDFASAYPKEHERNIIVCRYVFEKTHRPLVSLRFSNNPKKQCKMSMILRLIVP